MAVNLMKTAKFNPAKLKPMSVVSWGAPLTSMYRTADALAEAEFGPWQNGAGKSKGGFHPATLPAATPSRVGSFS